MERWERVCLGTRAGTKWAIPCVAAGLLLGGCGGVSSTRANVYSNPEGCEAVVEEHRLDPRDLGESGPRPLGVSMPPPTAETGSFRLEFVVDEFGVIVPNSVVVSGAQRADTRRALTENAQKGRFRPARVGECWVPARSGFEVTQGLGGWRLQW
jgi:hypothetical protein